MCRACRVYSPAMTLPLARSKRTAPDEIIALKCHASLSCVLHVDSWHLFCFSFVCSFLLMFKLLLFFFLQSLEPAHNVFESGNRRTLDDARQPQQVR